MRRNRETSMFAIFEDCLRRRGDLNKNEVVVSCFAIWVLGTFALRQGSLACWRLLRRLRRGGDAV
jgi:hypothetical protein